MTDKTAREIANNISKCTHCGKCNRVQQGINRSDFDEWVHTRIGPGARWSHQYCTEECASYAQIYSDAAWALIPQHELDEMNRVEAIATRRKSSWVWSFDRK